MKFIWGLALVVGLLSLTGCGRDSGTRSGYEAPPALAAPAAAFDDGRLVAVEKLALSCAANERENARMVKEYCAKIDSLDARMWWQSRGLTACGIGVAGLVLWLFGQSLLARITRSGTALADAWAKNRVATAAAPQQTLTNTASPLPTP